MPKKRYNRNGFMSAYLDCGTLRQSSGSRRPHVKNNTVPPKVKHLFRVGSLGANSRRKLINVNVFESLSYD